MSTQTVETVLNRAISDQTFREQLFANPDQALAGFELSAEELASFKSMSQADFETLAKATPEERISFARYSANHNETGLKIR